MYTIIRYYMIINSPTGQNFRLRAIRYDGVNEDKEARIIMRFKKKFGSLAAATHYTEEPVPCTYCGNDVAPPQPILAWTFCGQPCYVNWCEGFGLPPEDQY